MDLVLRCRKCKHLLFVGGEKINFELMSQLTERDCHRCGKQAGDCWILDRVGDYNKEFPNSDEGEESND